MIQIKRGDLLNAEETIIAHQVNCYGVAGGLAGDIFEKWPQAEEEYLERLEAAGYQPGTMLGRAQGVAQPDGKIIVNLYGQYMPGEDYRPEELKKALLLLAGIARYTKCSVALPYKLSCGICGGDWDEVYQMIEAAMNYHEVDCVIYRREEDE